MIKTRGLIATAPAPTTVAVEWRVDDAPVPYRAAVEAMEERAAAVAAGSARELVWLLEHPPLYTAGTSARHEHAHEHLREPLREPGLPVFVAGRGGQFTYHGPGQRVAYVMLDLRQRGADVRRFVAELEEWLIRTLAAFDIRGERREDRVGVWVRRPDKGAGREDKIAAIGIRVKRWISLHGASLNIDPDLTHFGAIVPCGITDPRFGVTSLADLGRTASLAQVDAVMRREFAAIFAPVR